jgi:hypothetical protein
VRWKDGLRALYVILKYGLFERALKDVSDNGQNSANGHVDALIDAL